MTQACDSVLHNFVMYIIAKKHIYVYISCNLKTKEVIAQDNNQNILVLTVEYSKMMEDGFSSQSSLKNIVVLSSVSSLVLCQALC